MAPIFKERNIMTKQEKIIQTLEGTKRQGIKGLIEWMRREGFFTSPASTRFHLCHRGGLAEHSWDVYCTLNDIYHNFKGIDEPISQGQKPLTVSEENIVIAGLLHDINKVGLYKPSKPGSKYKYYSNKNHPKGHGELSIQRIQKYIKMEDIEVLMIRFHMGIYGTFEMDDYCAEYPLRNKHSENEQYMTKSQKDADKAKRYCTSLRNCWYHNPICKFMSIADELASMSEKLSELE